MKLGTWNKVILKFELGNLQGPLESSTKQISIPKFRDKTMKFVLWGMEFQELRSLPTFSLCRTAEAPVL